MEGIGGIGPDMAHLPLIPEMSPFPGKIPEYTVEHSMALPEAAWAKV